MLARALACTAAVVAAALALALAGAPQASSAPPRALDACGVPDTSPVWIDYGEGTVRPDTRTVLARPGVVVATSGSALPRSFRARGAATAYFASKLAQLVGTPSAPADPATVAGAADALYARAAAATACATPWIGLNELFGAGLPAPWSPTNAQYRANVLALMQGLAAHGAHPALFVNGNPTVAGETAGWWRQVAQAGSIVYEAYFDARRIASLGSLLGNRRLRLGMRGVVALFTGAGVPPARVGLALGFHSGGGQGAGGRQGLQPRETWLRVVKWEALAARQVAADTRVGSVWSWGWGTFGPASVDADKPAAACVYLWARDRSLCDGPAAAGPGFNVSLTEGQLVLPPGVYCAFTKNRIAAADVTRLSALTGDRHAALDTLFARTVLRSSAPVTNAQVLAVERAAIARVFGGDRAAYLAALADAHATLGVARALVRDELRRRAIAARLRAAGSPVPPLQWIADRMQRAAGTALCRKDDLPGSGDFPSSDVRDVAVVPVLARLPFLFDDRVPPAPPAGVTAAPGPRSVSLAWTYGFEPDLAGYQVLRSTAPGGPYVAVTPALLARPAFVDRTAPPGVPSYYVVQAVDSSGNVSVASAEVSAAPA